MKAILAAVAAALLLAGCPAPAPKVLAYLETSQGYKVTVLDEPCSDIFVMPGGVDNDPSIRRGIGTWMDRNDIEACTLKVGDGVYAVTDADGDSGMMFEVGPAVDTTPKTGV